MGGCVLFCQFRPARLSGVSGAGHACLVVLFFVCQAESYSGDPLSYRFVFGIGIDRASHGVTKFWIAGGSRRSDE